MFSYLNRLNREGDLEVKIIKYNMDDKANKGILKTNEYR
jgi:hypothetical protein